MPTVGQIERHTQHRIVQLFKKQLHYDYLGNWEDRANNSNIEEPFLRPYLKKQGYSETLINKALDRLHIAANNAERSLYENNKEMYGYLRYGVKVKADVGDNYETVHLVNWKNLDKNQFSIAEEVTIQGER
jgi:type I restriction enzyme R subunit